MDFLMENTYEFPEKAQHAVQRAPEAPWRPREAAPAFTQKRLSFQKQILPPSQSSWADSHCRENLLIQCFHRFLQGETSPRAALEVFFGFWQGVCVAGTQTCWVSMGRWPTAKAISGALVLEEQVICSWSMRSS